MWHRACQFSDVEIQPATKDQPQILILSATAVITTSVLEHRQRVHNVVLAMVLYYILLYTTMGVPGIRTDNAVHWCVI